MPREIEFLGGPKRDKEPKDRKEKEKVLKIWKKNEEKNQEFGKHMATFIGSWISLFLTAINVLFLVISKVGEDQVVPYPIAIFVLTGFTLLFLLISMYSFITVYFPIHERFLDFDDIFKYYDDWRRRKFKTLFAGMLSTLIGITLSIFTLVFLIIAYANRYILS